MTAETGRSIVTEGSIHKVLFTVIIVCVTEEGEERTLRLALVHVVSGLGTVIQFQHTVIRLFGRVGPEVVVVVLDTFLTNQYAELVVADGPAVLNGIGDGCRVLES